MVGDAVACVSGPDTHDGVSFTLPGLTPRGRSSYRQSYRQPSPSPFVEGHVLGRCLEHIFRPARWMGSHSMLDQGLVEGTYPLVPKFVGK